MGARHKAGHDGERGSPNPNQMAYVEASCGLPESETIMTGQRGSAGLDVRRRRILFRAWHRGTREMDLTMGRFADAALRDLSDQELTDLEALLEAQDRDVFSWLTGELALPVHYDTPLFHRVRAFHTHDGPLDL